MSFHSSNARVVIVQQNEESGVWASSRETGFDQGTEIVYRRARLFVKAEAGISTEEIAWSFRMDKQIVAELGSEAVAKELATQMIAAFRELPDEVRS